MLVERCACVCCLLCFFVSFNEVVVLIKKKKKKKTKERGAQILVLEPKAQIYILGFYFLFFQFLGLYMVFYILLLGTRTVFVRSNTCIFFFNSNVIMSL